MKQHAKVHLEECKVLDVVQKLNPNFSKQIVKIGEAPIAPISPNPINWILWSFFILFMPLFFRPTFKEAVRELKEQGD